METPLRVPLGVPLSVPLGVSLMVPLRAPLSVVLGFPGGVIWNVGVLKGRRICLKSVVSAFGVYRFGVSV